MFNNKNELIGFILNLIQITQNLFAFFISLIVIIIIIYHMRNNQMKRDVKITLILCANIYILILLFMIVLVQMNIQTLMGNLYGQEFDTFWCMFLGYLTPVIFYTLYHAFVNQAFYRLCRIVYSQYRWLQFFWLYIILPFIQLILAFGIFYPLVLKRDLIYLPNEYFCSIKFSNLRAAAWISLNAYGIPLLLLLLMYIRIMIYIRRQPNIQAMIVKRRQRRDLIIIRRILITVSLLFTVGIPGMILIARMIITGEEHPLSHRISDVPVGLSIAILSVALIYSIPQLKSIVMEKRKRNRPMIIHGTTTVRNIVRIQ